MLLHTIIMGIKTNRTGRSTVISTNLDPEELGRRYGAPLLSRLEGEYQLLPFVGTDIRRLKRERG